LSRCDPELATKIAFKAWGLQHLNFSAMSQERRSAAKAISRQLVGEIRSLKQRSEEILRRLDELAREVETVTNKASRRAGHQA